MKRSVLVFFVCVVVVLEAITDCSAGTVFVDLQRHNSTFHKTPQIAGPLFEGALSYTDRTFHCFRDIPQHLIGAEYIQSVNSDKYTEFYELDVTLSQAVIMYLFLDNRLGHGRITHSAQYLEPDLNAAGMYWVQDQGFLDTGWDIGIDENGDGSINRYSSVFSRDVGPGVMTLFQQHDVTDVEFHNMYTVAAVVPEPTTLALLGLGVVLVNQRRRMN